MFCLLVVLALAVLALDRSGAVLGTSSPAIVIVGSGPSGIAASTKLLKHNFTDIIILEAENRIGGRIHSIQLGDAYVDLGAQFCHGEENNIVYTMVKDLEILKHSNQSVRYVRSNGEIVDKAITEKIRKFQKSLEASEDGKNGCGDVSSVGECLKIQTSLFTKTITDPKESEIIQDSYDWMKNHLACLDSPLDLCDLTLISAYKKCDGDLGLNWNGLGYKTILDVMMQKYPNPDNQLPIDDNILLQKQVVKINNWNQNGKMVIVTADGDRYKADHVILTPSVGVLKAKYKSLFNPALPEDKVKAIKNIGFGATVKVIMHFPVKWWDGNADWPFIWTAEDKKKLKQENLDWLSTISSTVQGENNEKVIISWFAGKYVPQIENLSEVELRRGLERLLTSFFSAKYNVTLPDTIIKTNWYSNPHFRGTYSYESVKGQLIAGDKLPDKLAVPLVKADGTPSVLFAGEATHPYYFSTVHGAIESGYREADRLIRFYNIK